jgi:DNA polymerase elongation subunit (family B)
MNKSEVLKNIKSFLDGYNNDLKYIVNIEADKDTNIAECVVHPPNGEKQILKIEYEPFLYVKDLKLLNRGLYSWDKGLEVEKRKQYGIKFEKLKTGNQKRLVNGFCFKVTSSRSFNAIVNYFKDGGIDPYEKLADDNGRFVKDEKDNYVYKNRDLFYSVKPQEQFLINKSARIFKGFEEYKDVHRVTFDIETTGLRSEISRVFSIGVRDNRGFEKILEVEKINDDKSELNLIVDFFNLVNYLKPAVICGYNSEDFDFEYLLGRVKLLNGDINKIECSLKQGVPIKRRNGSVKLGNTAEKYTATEMWGYSVIDILHASKKTAAINSDIKRTGLKYIAKFENIAREDRTYIKGEDNSIGRYYHENPYFLANNKNEHIEIPNQFKETAENLYKLQQNKDKISNEKYLQVKKYCLDNNKDFVEWFKKEALPLQMSVFVKGKNLVKKYLKDDLWETEQVDEIYNQSSFMLAKLVPTTYTRVCTMGTASIWNLLLTAWSYEKGIAIPDSDVNKNFSGGLARCYKTGFSKNIIKIDYASLYPMEQLSWDIFPLFDITNVFKQMLLYMTTTRNIYKKLANTDGLDNEETELMKSIDHDKYIKYTNNTLIDKERKLFKVKQLPIKILNNSLFGALGSGPSFNWSDNDCAARITCNGRLDLRRAVSWFNNFGCVPLLAVTDGVNFQIPEKTTIKVIDDVILYDQQEGLVDQMWKYGDKTGVSALIAYFNKNELPSKYMSVDDDGKFISCLNLSRINYALLIEKKDKKTGEIKRVVKLTGNTIKSKVLPEYIEEFIDNGLRLILEGDGVSFVDYYNNYVEDIFYKRIPLKKIASKSKYKSSIKIYLGRGVDKNGKDKACQAHMELIIREREKIAIELFEKHKTELQFSKDENELTIQEKLMLIDVYMPPEPELDSTVYYYNTGFRKSHGDSATIKDPETGDERFASNLIRTEDLIENPNIKGDYNIDKYLDNFNKRVSTILVGFDPEVRKNLIAKIDRKKTKDEFGNKVENVELIKNVFTKEQLQLKNFTKDELEPSMYLEDKEVEFWNETGFDPRLVWNGFKLFDDMKVHYEIYEHALNYVNGKLIKLNKKPIKSRNEKLVKGDGVLLKSGNVYSIGYFNGEYIEIKKENIDIPPSPIEIEINKKKEELNNEVKNLENVEFNSEKEENNKIQLKRRLEYYDIFKENFNLPYNNLNEFMLSTNGEGGELLDQFIVEYENQKNEEVVNYLGVD